MTYPQPWFIPGKGFFYLFTKYTNGRELYWRTSIDGINWIADEKLAGMGGHYQLSGMYGNKMVTVFNYHPGGNVDKRTNLYLLQSEDMGQSWQTIEGITVSTPVSTKQHAALVHDFEKENKLVYLNDLNFDKNGNPIVLVVISKHHQPGPQGDPREWMIFHWKNGKWNEQRVTASTHNYDMGSLYIEKENWTIIGPTEPGPQTFGTGGEMVVWESRNEGATWKKKHLQRIAQETIPTQEGHCMPTKTFMHFGQMEMPSNFPGLNCITATKKGMFSNFPTIWKTILKNPSH